MRKRESLLQAREPKRPATLTEAAYLLRERADLGRKVAFVCDWNALPSAAQEALYGIAGQLEYVAEFLESR